MFKISLLKFNKKPKRTGIYPSSGRVYQQQSSLPQK